MEGRFAGSWLARLLARIIDWRPVRAYWPSDGAPLRWLMAGSAAASLLLIVPLRGSCRSDGTQLRGLMAPGS